MAEVVGDVPDSLAKFVFLCFAHHCYRPPDNMSSFLRRRRACGSLGARSAASIFLGTGGVFRLLTLLYFRLHTSPHTCPPPTPLSSTHTSLPLLPTSLSPTSTPLTDTSLIHANLTYPPLCHPVPRSARV
eukprot:Selendium_serpulae@DN9474_c0_g1_i1.p1